MNETKALFLLLTPTLKLKEKKILFKVMHVHSKKTNNTEAFIMKAITAFPFFLTLIPNLPSQATESALAYSSRK